ncbi:MAG: Ig domain-containing protein [Patescibacteria group bacterium]
MNKIIQISLVALILGGAVFALGINTALADQTITRDARVGEYFTFTLENPAGWNGQMSHYALSIPIGASFDNASGRFTWTPQYAGQYTATFRTFSSFNDYCTTDVIINVNSTPCTSCYNNYNNTCASCPNPGPYNPPTCSFNIVGVPNSNVREGELFSYQIQTNGGGAKSYRVITGPPGLTVDANGWVRWVPNYDKARSDAYLVSVGVSDNYCELYTNFYIGVLNVIPYEPPYEPPVIPKPPVVPEPEPEPEFPCDRDGLCALLSDKELLTLALEKLNTDEGAVATEDGQGGVGFIAGAFAILGDVFSSGLVLFWLVLILLLLLYWEHRNRKLIEQEMKLSESSARNFQNSEADKRIIESKQIASDNGDERKENIPFQ